MLLPVTAGLMFASTTPSIADEPSCKAVVIGISLVCSDKPSPYPTKSPDPTPKPAPSQSAPEKPLPVEPVPAKPEPKTTTVVKEVVVVPPPAVQPAPVPTVTASPAVVTVTPSASPSPTAEAILPVNGEPASESTATPDILKQASEAGPYIFFVSLAVLIAMIITAKVKKLFPFEGGTHRAES
jgi:hypothetical protein